ncbi:MAG TPA: TetR/AcrR family transcriptional regulator [Acidimicrobiales bacterium]
MTKTPGTARQGRPPRNESQRAEHRRHLIASTVEAITEFGPEVSIDQIAKVAGVSKPILYTEFGGKNGMVDAIAEVLAEQVTDMTFTRFSPGTSVTFEEAINVTIDVIVTLIDENPHLYAFLIRNIRVSERGLLENALVRVIHEGAWMVIGLLNAEVDADQLAVVLDGVIGFVFTAVESWLVSRKPDKDQFVDLVATSVSAAVLALTQSQSTNSQTS